MSDEARERERTAYHESAHAVAFFLFGHSFKRVSIVREGDMLGHVVPRWFHIWTLDDLADEIVAVLAAEAFVQFVVDRRVPHAGYLTDKGQGSDLERVEGLAFIATGNEAEAQVLIRWLEWRTRRLISTPKFQHLVEALARQLLARNELSYREACRILNRALRTAPGRLRGRRRRAQLWFRTRRLWSLGRIQVAQFQFVKVARNWRRKRRR
jgi:hypothetical protein